MSAVWHANEVKGSIWHCVGPLASFVGSITSRCLGKWARTKTRLDRAAEIEPNSFAYFLKTKDWLTAGSTVITAIWTHQGLDRTSSRKDAYGSCYQSIHDLTPPNQPWIHENRTGDYVPGLLFSNIQEHWICSFQNPKNLPKLLLHELFFGGGGGGGGDITLGT